MNICAIHSTWTECLGRDRAVLPESVIGEFSANVSDLQRRVAAVLQPKSTDEVSQIVKIARSHKLPLYPFSCGLNWGFGSKLPVQDGATLVDLSGMNQIREVNTEYGYAVVEPGVTQGKLFKHLEDHQLPYLMNSTGAGPATSVLGNALERGDGAYGCKADDITGLEVVLGNGEVLQTGFGHFENTPLTHLFGYGVGPQLDGLFCQSNFGIVTSAGFKLRPKQAAHATFIVSIDHNSKLGFLIDTLKELQRSGFLPNLVRIGNRARSTAALGPQLYQQLIGCEKDPQRRLQLVETILKEAGLGAWSAIGAITGTPQRVRETISAIKRSFSRRARAVFLSDRKIAFAKNLSSKLRWIPFFHRQNDFIKAIEPLYGMTKGIPSSSALASLHWSVKDLPAYGDNFQPDQSHCGMLFLTPAIPMKGSSLECANILLEQHFANYNFEHFATWNMLNANTLGGVVNLVFDRRDPQRSKEAHQCIDSAFDLFLERGWIPYRVGIQSMDKITKGESTFWDTVTHLKRALDPEGIIAPGRYSRL